MLSTTTAKLAVTVPAVTASRTFNSAAVVVTAVPPISNLSFTMSITAPPAVNNLSALSSHNKYAPEVALNIFICTPVWSTPKVVAPSICTVPSISTASRLVVPSISAFPDISKVAASNSPVRVTFLKLATSLFESTVTTLLATTVPTAEPVSL